MKNILIPCLFAEDTIRKYFVNFLAELIGTALLMFLGCMGCIPQVDDPPAVHHFAGLSFGLVVLIVIQIFAHISMAHINPGVTIGAVLLKIISPVMGVVYIVAQFIGATFGVALLKLVMPQEWIVPGFCVTKPHALITPIQALIIEIIISMVLLLVCCAVWDKRNSNKMDSVSVRFGFVIAVISMVAGPLTGASMNTARSFAPAVLAGDYSYHWIYWIGPNVGAVIAWGMYTLLFAYKKEASEDDGAEHRIERAEVNRMLPAKA